MSAKKIGILIFKLIINKYTVSFAAFVVWIMFFDENNIIQQKKNQKELTLLQQQADFYKHKIVADKRKLYELQTNNANLEKFAREQFFMKKDNEDIYVIVEDN
jgi:cell division protein DivIC